MSFGQSQWELILEITVRIGGWFGCSKTLFIIVLPCCCYTEREGGVNDWLPCLFVFQAKNKFLVKCEGITFCLLFRVSYRCFCWSRVLETLSLLFICSDQIKGNQISIICLRFFFTFKLISSAMLMHITLLLPPLIQLVFLFLQLGFNNKNDGLTNTTYY